VTSRSPISKAARFLLVGGLGFIVDAGMLALLVANGTGPFTARIVSILLAMLVTWRLNRSMTFGASHDGQLREVGRYIGVAATVAALNYAIYAGILVVMPTCPPVLATAIATGLCTIASFFGYGKFAFRAS